MSTNQNKKTRKNAIKRAQANAQIAQMHGQGGYYSDKVVPFMSKLVPKGSFANMGGSLGGALGVSSGIPGAPLMGGAAGSYLGSRIAKLVGFGDYSVQSNTLMKQGMAIPEGAPLPAFGNLGHETRVTHREYIRDIIVPATPTAFTLESQKINAGNNSLFPWLAPIAASYQQYRFNGLVFEFRSLSSDITAGGALGAVILGTNYDVIDSTFASKLAMENAQYSVSAKPSLSQYHAIECDPALTANKLYYVRDSTAGSGTSDDRFYDLGNFQVATQGLPSSAGTVIGELWVTYDISLFKPEIATASGSATQHIVGVSPSPTSVFGTTPTSTGAALCTASGSTLTFSSPGTYMVEIQASGTVFTSVFPLTGTATSTFITQPSPLPGTITTFVVVYKIVCNTQNQTAIFPFSGAATLTASSTNVTPVTSSFVA